MAAKKQVEAKYCVITNKSYGVYVGWVDEVTADPNSETNFAIPDGEGERFLAWYGFDAAAGKRVTNKPADAKPAATGPLGDEPPPLNGNDIPF